MGNSTRRALLLTMLATVTIAASACGPEAYEGWSQIFSQLIGGALGIGVILLIIAANLPKV